MEVPGGKAHLKTYHTIRYDSATVVLTVFSAAGLLAGIPLALNNRDSTLAIGATVMLLMFLTLGWPARYGLTTDRLKWHHGMVVNKSLVLSEIDRIVPGDARSGMTMSKVPGHLIYAGRKQFFVSAMDHQEFLAALLEQSPHLKQYGFEWRRELRSEQ